MSLRGIGCVALLAAAAMANLAGCRSAPAFTPQQAEGKYVYDQGCAHCHEENDLHLKKVPPNLHGLFSRKTLPDGAPATDAEVERVLLAGVRHAAEGADEHRGGQLAPLF